MNIQTLPLNKLRNISYPEKTITLFILNLYGFHFNDLLSLRETYPFTDINVFTNESKLSFLYRNSIKALSILLDKNITIYFSSSIEIDMLVIDNITTISLVYFDNSIHLSTSEVSINSNPSFIAFNYNALEGLFVDSNNSYISIINNLTLSDIQFLLNSLDYSHTELTSNDIPQFSNFENSTTRLIHVLSNIEQTLTYDEVGLLLTEGDKKAGAYKKYGENQSKTGSFLELVTINSTTPKTVSLTPLGESLLSVDETIFHKVIFFEILKSKLFKLLLSLCQTNDEVDVKEICLKVISEKTYIRRRSNIKYLINFLRKQEIESLNILLDKLILN